MAAFLAILVGGCGLIGGSDRMQMSVSDYYNQYLPMVREIHHPDSVRADDETSFRDLRMDWSVNHTVRFGGRDYSPTNFSTFATLWSRDLSMRSAALGLGLGEVTADVRERAMDEQMQRYDSVLAFEVHMFVPAARGYSVSDTQLRSAGMNIVLQDDQRNEYRPFRVESDAAEEFQMMPNQVPVYHRTNRVYFERRPDGRDILEGVEALRLVVRTTGAGSDEIWFSWRFS